MHTANLSAPQPRRANRRYFASHGRLGAEPALDGGNPAPEQVHARSVHTLLKMAQR